MAWTLLLGLNMKSLLIASGLIAATLGSAACGGSYPVPTQRMADAQAAHRSAQELGADKNPDAQLHLKLAEEQIGKAESAMKEENNRRADFLLVRAKADAELALAIAKEQKAKKEAQEALDKANSTAATNARAAAGANQGVSR